VRSGKLELGAAWGLVVAGREDADWYLAGIDERGQGGLWTVRVTAKGATTVKRLSYLPLERPVTEDEEPELAAHVYGDGRVELRVGGRASVSGSIPLAGAIPRGAGIFVKNGAAAFRDLLLEIYP